MGFSVGQLWGLVDGGERDHGGGGGGGYEYPSDRGRRIVTYSGVVTSMRRRSTLQGEKGGNIGEEERV